MALEYRTIDQLNQYLEKIYGDMYVAVPSKYVDYLMSIWCTEFIITNSFINHMKELGFKLKHIKMTESEKMIANFEVN